MSQTQEEYQNTEAARAWIRKWPKEKRCPVIGCTRTWKTKAGLGGHLYLNHRKNELIAIIIALLGL